MGLFGGGPDHQDDYDQVYGDKPHDGSFTHEMIGGAAAFFAMRKYEEHCAAEGKPASHALAKEMIAGICAAEADKLIETKGADYLDRERAKEHARKEAMAMYDAQHGNDDMAQQ